MRQTNTHIDILQYEACYEIEKHKKKHKKGNHEYWQTAYETIKLFQTVANKCRQIKDFLYSASGDQVKHVHYL